MGCNGSKQDDVHNSRQRAGQETPSKTASMKIGGGQAAAPDNTENTAILGTSYTDQRQAEQDYFKEIIDRTAQSFIDVSSVPVAIDKKDAQDRSKEYVAQLSEASSTAAMRSLQNLHSLPNTSGSNITSAMLSEETRLTSNDVELIRKSLDAVVLAAQFKVKDVGDIIIPFE